MANNNVNLDLPNTSRTGRLRYKLPSINDNEEARTNHYEYDLLNRPSDFLSPIKGQFTAYKNPNYTRYTSSNRPDNHGLKPYDGIDTTDLNFSESNNFTETNITFSDKVDFFKNSIFKNKTRILLGSMIVLFVYAIYTFVLSFNKREHYNMGTSKYSDRTLDNTKRIFKEIEDSNIESLYNNLTPPTKQSIKRFVRQYLESLNITNNKHVNHLSSDNTNGNGIKDAYNQHSEEIENLKSKIEEQNSRFREFLDEYEKNKSVSITYNPDENVDDINKSKNPENYTHNKLIAFEKNILNLFNKVTEMDNNYKKLILENSQVKNSKEIQSTVLNSTVSSLTTKVNELYSLLSKTQNSSLLSNPDTFLTHKSQLFNIINYNQNPINKESSYLNINNFYILKNGFISIENKHNALPSLFSILSTNLFKLLFPVYRKYSNIQQIKQFNFERNNLLFNRFANILILSQNKCFNKMLIKGSFRTAKIYSMREIESPEVLFNERNKLEGEINKTEEGIELTLNEISCNKIIGLEIESSGTFEVKDVEVEIEINNYNGN